MLLAINFFSLVIYISPFASSKDWRKVSVYLGHMKPPYASVFENTPVTIYCGSTSKVTWEYRPQIGSSINRTAFFIIDRIAVPKRHLQENKKITLVKLTRDDSGLYSCKGKTGMLMGTFIREMELKVYKEVPNALVLPTRIEVSAGSTVTLRCGSLKPVEWFSVHFRVQNKSMIGNTLTLYNLNKKHSGRYVCRGSGANTEGVFVFHRDSIIIVDPIISQSSRERNWSDLLTLNDIRPY